MKKAVFFALALVFVALGASAQNNNRGQRQRIDPTEMYTRMGDRLAKDMKLEDDKAELFKVLYLDYQMARRNALNPKGEEETNERVDLKKITDEKATELIKKHLDGQEAQAKVDKDYLAKFLEILTPSQAAQIYLQRMGGGMMQRGGNGGGRGFGGGFPGGGFQGGFPGGGFGE